MPAHAGSKNSGAKLTTAQVKKIWKRLQKGDTCVAISKDYPDVSYGAIAKIHRGEAWNCITGLTKHEPIPRQIRYQRGGKKNG